MDYIELVFDIKTGGGSSDVLVAYLSEAGFDTFEETAKSLKAYIPAHEFKESLLLNFPFDPVTYSKNVIPAKNWNEEWEKSFQPVEVEDFCRIRAPFHPVNSNFKHEIIIEPKMSFGTGHHATTWLMIKQMRCLNFVGKKILDMGCGTGVLSILASKLGAEQIIAVDIDEWAYNNTLENNFVNSINNIKVFHGDISILSNESFDIILANINRNIIIKDIKQYSSMLASGGYLLVSGFLDVDVEILESAATNEKMELVNQEVKDHWALLSFFKK